jgi:hypothetical protein
VTATSTLLTERIFILLFKKLGCFPAFIKTFAVYSSSKKSPALLVAFILWHKRFGINMPSFTDY